MSDQTDHMATSAPLRHEITISVGGDSEDCIQVKTTPSTATPTPSPRSLQSSTDEATSTNSTDDDNVALAPKQKPDTINGVDNLAFETDQKPSQLKTMNSFGQNGDSNGTKTGNLNGKHGLDKPLTGESVVADVDPKLCLLWEKIPNKFWAFSEAVNLELVNLNKAISNGHRDNGYSQKKKEATQVEIGDPYNEYFVPVNEHKKYMR